MIRQFKPFLSCLLILSAAVLAQGADSTQPRKADFLDEKELAFIRPGLLFTIETAWVESDGTVKYRFSLTDPKGAPLDLNGVFTPGDISISSLVAYIPQGDTLYRSYITRTRTSPTGESAEQAATDSGGSFQKLSDGVYLYTFGTKLPSGYEANSTHTVGAYVRRDLSEFNLGTNLDADTFDWVPAGGDVIVTRQIVTDQQCNQCHGQLVAHGRRTEVAVCQLCHTPQSTDPVSGNTVDLTTMVHKIHMGEGLPSVEAGKPYFIRRDDYSDVVFPADVRNCQTCHIETKPETAALSTRRGTSIGGRIATLSVRGRSQTLAQAEARGLTLTSNQHLLRPSRRACGSCHDEVNFATGENHAGLPQISDTQCSRCHAPEGELEFDLSIKGSHTIERFSKELKGVNFELFGVANGAPGQTPTVEFGVTDNAGQPIELSQMSRLSLVLAGDNQSLADLTQTISENALSATGQSGRYFYSFQQPIPGDATGSWAVGIEGRRDATLLAGTLQERSVREAGENKTLYFSLTGGAATPRRQVVATTSCNNCHFSLSFHGSNRNTVDQCVLCHNTTLTDAEDRPADQGPAVSANFKEMIHRIHTGQDLTRDYTIWRSRPTNFNDVRYPRERTDCSACHVDGSQLLPLPSDLASTTEPGGFFNPAPPITGACLSCHDHVPAAAHADLMTSPTYGESCEVCHGQGAEFAVDKSHAR